MQLWFCRKLILSSAEKHLAGMQQWELFCCCCILTEVVRHCVAARSQWGAAVFISPAVLLVPASFHSPGILASLVGKYVLCALSTSFIFSLLFLFYCISKELTCCLLVNLPPCQLRQYYLFSQRGISNPVNSVLHANSADCTYSCECHLQKHEIKILNSADLVIKFTPVSGDWALTLVTSAQPAWREFIQAISDVAVKRCLGTADSSMSFVVSVRGIFLILCVDLGQSLVGTVTVSPFTGKWSELCMPWSSLVLLIKQSLYTRYCNYSWPARQCSGL